jgi:hypothetical protein
MATIKMFHQYLTGKFREDLASAYLNHEVVSEAEGQAVAWSLIRQYLPFLPDRSFGIRIEPFCGDMHPDLVVTKYGEPWVCIEIKERGRFCDPDIEEDRRRLDRMRAWKKRGAKRGYLVYFSRHGKTKDFPPFPRRIGPQTIVPIVISAEERLARDEWKTWNAKFKKLSRFEAAGLPIPIRAAS